MAKMTPGPWEMIKRRSAGAVIVMSTADGARVQVTRVWNEANARAIAALPELIEAARNLLSACNAYKVPDTFTVDMRRILARIEGGE